MKSLPHMAIAALLLASAAVAHGFPQDAAPSDNTTVQPFREGWKGLRVLHIGDSHLENWGLKGTLRRHFEGAGATYTPSAWVGSNSRGWLVTGRLSQLLRKTTPDVVIVNLGTNALKHPKPSSYGVWVKRMVARIAPRRCYWIGPPRFFEDTAGVYPVLQETSRPCAFFDSRDIDFNLRGVTNFHLSRNQSTLWADRIWEWLNRPEAAGGL